MRRTNAAPDMNRFRSVLKSKGLKSTPQRLAVHEAMLSLGHASVDQVCSWIAQKGTAEISVASVYNILSDLSAIGIYRRIPSPGSKTWYDITTYPHVHIYDRRKDEFKDLADPELMGMVNAWYKEHRPKGYRIDDIEVQLICHPGRRSKKDTI